MPSKSIQNKCWKKSELEDMSELTSLMMNIWFETCCVTYMSSNVSEKLDNVILGELTHLNKEVEELRGTVEDRGKQIEYLMRTWKAQSDTSPLFTLSRARDNASWWV